MSIKQIYPWQAQQWAQLQSSHQAHRLPHALLFMGVKGLGKAAFADYFSQSLLCQQTNANGEPCGQCHDCSLMMAKSHPNILWIIPDGQSIKVDQIRAVSEFTNQTALKGKHRIVVIHPASSMNAQAANALLKTLEEPTSDVHIILISDQSERLPATILSRCQRIIFSAPSKHAALEWLNNDHPDLELLLNLSQGAPLQVQHGIENDSLTTRKKLFELFYSLSLKQADPVQAASQRKDELILQDLDFILTWLMDIVRWLLTQDESHLINYDFKNALIEISCRVSKQACLTYMQYLQSIRQLLLQGLNLNKQLVMEDVFIRWAKLCF